ERADHIYRAGSRGVHYTLGEGNRPDRRDPLHPSECDPQRRGAGGQYRSGYFLSGPRGLDPRRRRLFETVKFPPASSLPQTIAELRRAGELFDARLRDLKQRVLLPDYGWYPYHTMT